MNFTLPKFDALAPYWKAYFEEVDLKLEENFWGNLPTLKIAEQYNDPYIQQQKEMGYSFIPGEESPATFYQALEWVFKKFQSLLAEGTLTNSDILLPAKVFEIINAKNEPEYVYIPIGGNIPENATEVNILKPAVFVDMLAEGFFPIGSSYRAHTNQTLAEHDLAHFAGFIGYPRYMKAIREAFRRVRSKMQTNPKVKLALENFDSVYSLRLYYMVEVFTIIPEDLKSKLQNLIEIPLHEQLHLQTIIEFLEDKAKNPKEFFQYLYRIYNHFPSLVEPVGGESRDILNRTRKFNRGGRLGNFYSQMSNLGSKFDGSSIYSLYQNGLAALENKRSTHPDFIEAIREIHAPFIGTLIGTSQLTVEDWVLQAVEEIPDPNSRLYQYLCGSGMWNRSHVIYWAYGEPEYTTVLKESDMDE